MIALFRNTKLFRRLKIVVSAVLLLLAVYLILTSSYVICNVYLPLLSSYLHLHINARDVRFSLFHRNNIRCKDLNVSMEGKIYFSAARFYGHVMLFDLFCGIRSRIIAGHACPHGSVSDERGHVYVEIALSPVFKVRIGARVKTVEETASDILPIWGIFLHPERGEGTVSGDLGRDALLNKRFVELLGIIAVIEEVIVRMGIDEARADLKAFDIDDLICRLFNVPVNLQDRIVFDQNVSLKRSAAGAVNHEPVFEQCFHG